MEPNEASVVGIAIICGIALFLSLFGRNIKTGVIILVMCLVLFLGFRSGLMISFFRASNLILITGIILTIFVVSYFKKKRSEPDSAQKTKQNSRNVSVADELEKLNLLKEKGVITEAEFERQKNKLLK